MVGAWLTRKPLKHLTEPRETLQPIVALSAAGLIFGTATAIHGSGFLAVFVAGLLLGDANTTVGEDVRAFHSELAGLAEVVVFISLGLTVHLAALGVSGALQGLTLTVVLLALARPPAAMLLLAPFRVPRGERIFLAWAGMRGAVPICSHHSHLPTACKTRSGSMVSCSSWSQRPSSSKASRSPRSPPHFTSAPRATTRLIDGFELSC